MAETNMNVLFVSTFELNTKAGGVGTVTTTLAKEFLLKGCKVYFLSFSNGIQKVTEEGITHYFIPDEKKKWSPQNVSYINNLIFSLNIDVIINHAGFNEAVLKTVVAANEGKSKILTVHNNCIACLLQNYKSIISINYQNHKFFKFLNNKFFLEILEKRYVQKTRKLYKYILKNSDRLVLLSPDFIEEFKYFVPDFPAEKVIAILNPLRFLKAGDIESKKENILLYVGRIEFQQKRIDLLIEIWKKIYKKYPDWKLEIVGSGSAENEIKKIADNGKIERISFFPYQDPRPFFERAKIFCLTSAFEGFGMVLVEAQAYGTVPVAFRCFNGINEVMPNGIIIESFDTDMYVKNLEELMQQDAYRKTLAKKVQEDVEKFDSKEIAVIWYKLFNKLKTER